MNEFFNYKNLVFFYVRFILNKWRIVKDSKGNKLQIAIIELLWISRRVLNLSIYSSFLIYKDYYQTQHGKFLINKDLQSAITISPTFEIDDINELKSLIFPYVKKKDRVLFIDIGAHVGVYSISIGNRFKNYRNIDIIAFEPDANNFYKSNSSLFLRNIKLNKLNNIKLHKIGLGSKNTNKPNKFGFVTKKLDSILSKQYAKRYDVVFIKIDIEGYEEDALRGAKLFIENCNMLYLLVEDCVDKKIFKYMKKNFKFYKKISPYNSFWTK